MQPQGLRITYVFVFTFFKVSLFYNRFLYVKQKQDSQFRVFLFFFTKFKHTRRNFYNLDFSSWLVTTT